MVVGGDMGPQNPAVDGAEAVSMNNEELVEFCLGEERKTIEARMRSAIADIRRRLNMIERDLNEGALVGGSFGTSTEMLFSAMGSWDALHRCAALFASPAETP